jgi:hypothetical protein
MRKDLMLLLLLFVFFIPLSFSGQEEITFTTYYPSPYGSYRVLNMGPTTRPANPGQGDIYYDNGLGGISGGMYYYNGTDWIPMGGLTEEQWVGGLEAGDFQQSPIAYNNWFSPSRTNTWWYQVNNYTLKAGSNTALHLTASPQVVWFDLSAADITSGMYRLEYGGGTASFLGGGKFKVALWVAMNGGSWYSADEFYLENPAARDGVQCNFSTGVANIPRRSVQFYLYRNSYLVFAVAFEPVYEALDWEHEIGVSNLYEAGWIAAGRPSFASTTAGNPYKCDPNMLGQKCPLPLAPPAYDPFGWSNYGISYWNIQTVNSWGAANFSGFNIDIYKNF